VNGRRLRILLALSLAANLFLGGLFIGGGLLRGERGERGSRHAAFARALEQLDPADAEALRTLMRTRGEQAEPRVQALRAARREVQALMARPDYDPAAVRAALTRVRIEETALRDNLDRDLVDFAARLDPEERAAITPLLRKGGRGWKSGRREAAERR
jgi:uncharacterized membrane protein